MAATVEQYEPPFHRTFAWVTGGHVVLIMLILIGVWLAPQQREPVKFINMVELGEMVQGNPTADRAKSVATPVIPPAPVPEPTPVEPPVKAVPEQAIAPAVPNPTPPPVQPKAITTPLPGAKPEAQPIPKPEPKQKVAPKPKAKAKPKPKPKPKIKVNLNQVTRSTQAPKPKPQKVKANAATPNQLLDKLNQALEKAGSTNGPKRRGASGSPDGSKNDHAAYYRLIRDQMFDAWSAPVDLINDGLQTIVQIKLAPDGRIMDIKLVRSSGNDEHDKTSLAAARTVKRIRKPLPSGMDPRVEINFRLQR